MPRFRTHRSALPVAALLFTLSACTMNPPRDIPPTGGPNPPAALECHGEAAQDAVGKVATAAVVEQARKDAGAQTARVLKPGQMVTMEYLEGRLNIYVDERNVITRVACG